MSNDDKMSSVSKSSRFSAKSQIIIEAQDKVIAEQGGQISNMAKEMALMKKMLVEAGIKTVSGEVEVEVEEKKQARKDSLRGHLMVKCGCRHLVLGLILLVKL